MSTPRVIFAATLVAAAWATVISGLVAVGAAKAEAAWQTTSPGSGTAKGTTLPAPSGLNITGSNCTGNPKVSLTWTNPATGIWTGLDVVAAPSATSTTFTVIGTSTGSSISNAQLPYTPAYISVRTIRSNWRGRSPAQLACP
ncbi:hypothetical protein [Amycolatopsis kentuckyensis]|uniref:hypothetical protein n=1 Tax=Amycolatopsis kentuckyensis TaxID=218823 RepID=UPI0011785CB1|nr:hypothetical protein [Amycolatopsis kentuckyensis]